MNTKTKAHTYPSFKIHSSHINDTQPPPTVCTTITVESTQPIRVQTSPLCKAKKCHHRNKFEFIKKSAIQRHAFSGIWHLCF